MWDPLACRLYSESISVHRERVGIPIRAERRAAQDIVVRELLEYEAYLAEPCWPESRALFSPWKKRVWPVFQNLAEQTGRKE